MAEVVESVENRKDLHNGADRAEILLKGTGYGVRMILPEALPDERLLEELLRFSGDAARLARGIGVVLDLQGRSLTRPLLLALLSQFVWTGDFKVLSWMSYNVDTLELLRSSGFSIGEPMTDKPERSAGSNTLVLYQSLRSGQRVEHNFPAMRSCLASNWPAEMQYSPPRIPAWTTPLSLPRMKTLPEE